MDYLQLHKGIWRVRRVVPPPLVARVGKATLVRSTGERDFGKAQRVAAPIVREFAGIIAAAKRRMPPAASPSTWTKIIVGDARETITRIDDASIQTIVTSPPYFGLRDYEIEGQAGLEETPQQYVDALVGIFRECRRVLRPDGTLWLNIGDSYARDARKGQHKPGDGTSGKQAYVYERGGGRASAGVVFDQQNNLKPKDLIGIPWLLAVAMRNDGWYLRSDIIWHKPNALPESVQDRPANTYEHIFLFSRCETYYYDAQAVAVPKRWSAGRNQRNLWFAPADVWEVNTKPFAGAHFATFPEDLIEPCIKAGSMAGSIVLDPFGGSGTTGLVANRLGRNAILLEINPSYAAMSRDRIDGEQQKTPA